MTDVNAEKAAEDHLGYWFRRIGTQLSDVDYEEGTITIPRPHVPYGPEGLPAHIADADYLVEAAQHIEGGYPVGGSNLTATVIRLLRDVAAAIRAAGRDRESADTEVSDA